MGGDWGGFGMMDGGMMCKGKGKKGINPKVIQAIEECIKEIEEREGLAVPAGMDPDLLLADGLGDIGGLSPMMLGAVAAGAFEAPKPAATPTPSAAPKGGGGGLFSSGGSQPTVKKLQVAGGNIAAQGFLPESYGVEHSKEHNIFSESHSIINEYLYQPGKLDLTFAVEYCHDSDGNEHPEVYQAWIAAGGEENLPCVAKVKELGKWAVGFGGKKNAERAAKLALAIAIGLDSEHTPEVVRRYPAFGTLMEHVRSLGGAPAGSPAGFTPY